MARFLVEIRFSDLKWLTHVNRRHGAVVASSDGTSQLRQEVDVPDAAAEAWRSELGAVGSVRVVSVPTSA